jgi:uncharacterized protein YukE
MKKRTLLLSMVFVFALVAIVNSAAIAQDQAHQNLKDMSELLKDISVQLNSGKMTPEAQKTAGIITQQASQLLQELAGLGSETHSKHQKDIKKMKKSWDPFAEQAATED